MSSNISDNEESGWTNLIKKLHAPIIDALVTISRTSASNPKRAISLVILLSIGVMAIGVLTNFHMEVDEDKLWAPRGSLPDSHNNWVDEKSGFPLAPRVFGMTVHANGVNVLEREGVSRVFTALDTIRNTSGYDELCQGGAIKLDDGGNTCRIVSVTNFWNNSLSFFEDNVETDDQAISVISQSIYPDGSPVDHAAIMGNAEVDDNGVLTSSPIFMLQIYLPRSENDDDDPADNFEEIALEHIQDLQDAWVAESGNKYRVEFFADRSFADEFARAIVDDIPLVPAVFITMSVFTSLIFFKRDQVQSRSTLGFGAVCCVLLAIMTGYGLLFTIGTPFTSMTQILPFSKSHLQVCSAFSNQRLTCCFPILSNVWSWIGCCIHFEWILLSHQFTKRPCRSHRRNSEGRWDEHHTNYFDLSNGVCPWMYL